MTIIIQLKNRNLLDGTINTYKEFTVTISFPGYSQENKNGLMKLIGSTFGDTQKHDYFTEGTRSNLVAKDYGEATFFKWWVNTHCNWWVCI